MCIYVHMQYTCIRIYIYIYIYRTYHTIPYHTIPYHTIPYHTITIHYNTITIHYNTLQYITIHYNTLQYITIQYNTIQYNTIQSIHPSIHPCMKSKSLMTGALRGGTDGFERVYFDDRNWVQGVVGLYDYTRLLQGKMGFHGVF